MTGRIHSREFKLQLVRQIENGTPDRSRHERVTRCLYQLRGALRSLYAVWMCASFMVLALASCGTTAREASSTATGGTAKLVTSAPGAATPVSPTETSIGKTPIAVSTQPNSSADPPPVPQYPAARLISKEEKGNGGRFDYSYTTGDDAETVKGFYLQEAPKAGWRYTPIQGGAPDELWFSSRTAVADTAGYYLVVEVSRTGGQTSIAVTVMWVPPVHEPPTPGAAPVIPEYPMAKLVKTEGTDTRVIMAKKYTTSDDVETVMSFYREEVPKYGWVAWVPPAGKQLDPGKLVYQAPGPGNTGMYELDVLVWRNGQDTNFIVQRIFSDHSGGY